VVGIRAERRLGALAFAIATMGGCSNDPDSWLAPQRDGGAAGGSAIDGCSTPICVSTGNCNDVANDGPKVIPAFVTGLPPAPMGGIIDDGKWTMTAYTLYSAADGGGVPVPEWARQAVQVTGSRLEVVTSYRSESFDHDDAHASYSIATSGAALTLTGTCGALGKGSLPYSASPTEMKWYYLTFVGFTAEETYIKQ
jgi:hypothetical protein